MAETREFILIEENWQKIDKLLIKFPDSNFLEFCLLNDIIEKGLENLEEQFTINKQG